MKAKRSLVHPPPAWVVFLKKACFSVWQKFHTGYWEWRIYGIEMRKIHLIRTFDVGDFMINEIWFAKWETNPSNAISRPRQPLLQQHLTSKASRHRWKQRQREVFRASINLLLKETDCNRRPKMERPFLTPLQFAISNLNLLSTNVTHLVWNKLQHRNTKWDAMKIR